MNDIRKYELLLRFSTGPVRECDLDWTPAEVDELVAENLIEAKFCITPRGHDQFHGLRRQSQTTYSCDPPHPLRGGPPHISVPTPGPIGASWLDPFLCPTRVTAPPAPRDAWEAISDPTDFVSMTGRRRSRLVDYVDIETRVLANLSEDAQHVRDDTYRYVGVDVARHNEPGISPFITFDDLVRPVGEPISASREFAAEFTAEDEA